MGWDQFQTSPAIGIEIILAHTPESEKAKIAQAVAASLSHADVQDSEASDPLRLPNKSAAHWLQAAVAVIQNVQSGQVSISIPGSPRFRWRPFSSSQN